jgi:hypothetical protein
VTNELKIPSLESSLLAYKLQVNTKHCEGELFRPFVRQSIAEPYESKFFVNVHDADLNLHGLPPYLVSQVRRNGAVTAHGVTLQFWTDPSCDAPLDIQVKFDLLGSLGKTVIRYRIASAAFPIAIVALCLKRQFSEYNAGGKDIFDTSDDRLFLEFRRYFIISDSRLPADAVILRIHCISMASFYSNSGSVAFYRPEWKGVRGF